MNLFANDLAGLVRSMNFLISRGDVYIRGANIIRARGADSPGGNLHSGALENAAVDGVANIHVAIAFTVSSDVTHRCEARAKRGLRVPDGHERPGFLGRCHARAVTEAAVNMCVRVDQTGQNRSLAEVNYLNSRRNLDLVGRTDVRNFFAVDQHNLIGQHRSRLTVEQVARADCDHSGSLRP